MFGQARGGLAQILFQHEPGFRTRPGTPNAVALPFTSYGVFRNPKRTKDNSINSSPLPAKSGCGDATIEAASIKSILDLRTIGFWLSCLLGMPTTQKAVTKQPTNVTGVTIHYAQATAGAGDGTLEYADTGKTLTWTDQGGTAGTPVDVTAGGRFTIPAGTADHGIVVEVAAAQLPATDKTDSDIAVSASLKAHVFPFNLSDRPTALLERGHSDVSTFLQADGIFVGKLAYDVLASEQSIDLTVIGGGEVDATTTWDATPTQYESVRACGHGGYISDGASAALGTITGGDLSCDLGAKGEKVANQREGYGLIEFGEISLGGNLKAVFDGDTAWRKARDGDSTRLRIGSATQTSAGIFSLYWDIPNAELEEKSKPLEGKSGLFVDVAWMAHRVTAGSLPLVVLVNDVASYVTTP